MPAETSFAKIKYAAAADEVKAFPAEVSEPGAKTIDKFLEEHTPTSKEYAAGATLKSGEYAVQAKSGETFTLPSAATSNQLIGVHCASGATSAKVTTSGGAVIYGDFTSAAGTITLTASQHVWLLSITPNWVIIAGEPRREEAYSALVARARSTGAGVNEFTPSATRPTLVVASFSAVSTKQLRASVIIKNAGGSEITMAQAEGISATSTLVIPATFEVPASATWRWTGVAETTCESSYLVR